MTRSLPVRFRAALRAGALGLAAAGLWTSGLAGLAAQTQSPAVEPPGQLRQGARFGAWQLGCEAIGVGQTLCVLTQRMMRRGDNRYVAELLLFWDGTVEQAWLVARVPNGAFLAERFTLHTAEEGEGTALIWQSCLAEICEAALPLDAATLRMLEEAGTLRAIYRPAPGAAPLAFRLTLEGGGAGLEALAEALSR